MAPVATGSMLPAVDRISSPSSGQSVEEVCFTAALVILEGHYRDNPPIPGPLTRSRVMGMISRTLEKTHSLKDVRQALARNVEAWIYLVKIFAAALPTLTARSVGPLSSLGDPERCTAQESNNLIISNYTGLKEDLQTLNKLMHIARNLLVSSEPEIPQDICAAVNFDQIVYQTIILCLNVTSKGYDSEVVDDAAKIKLNEINDLYKKLLVTSLQQAHNWTAKNDRNKMAFWSDVLFDDDAALDDTESSSDGLGFRLDICKTEVQNWLERNSQLCDGAQAAIKEYVRTHTAKAPGLPAVLPPFSGNWIPNVRARAEDLKDTRLVEPHWDPDETDKFAQDQAWGRVSHEIDSWWEKAREQNFGGWHMDLLGKDSARARQASFTEHLDGGQAGGEGAETGEGAHGHAHAHGRGSEGDNGSRDLVRDYVDELEDEIDDNESYGEGPMVGLLTEIPNVLDPKQIEALHMIIKSCILDGLGGGLTKYGENLQKTRCRMFLATDCGKSLLREILVFIAVWEKDEQSIIFELTTSIVEAIHDVALIPYAWNALRIPKDVISPAQAVLLRLINHMFRKRYTMASSAPTIKDDSLDLKLVHYLFGCIRTRVIPECLAFLSWQTQIRRGNADPADFPVDHWDMERARDGLAQVLDFLTTVSEIDGMRAKLVEWEAVFELITLLRGLEDGVEKKPIVPLPDRSGNRVPPQAAAAATPAAASSASEQPQQSQQQPQQPPYQHYHHHHHQAQHQHQHQHYPRDAATTPGMLPPPPPPPPPPAHEPAHKFPWAGIKGHVLTILANLLQPEKGKKGPGNPVVQRQIMKQNGIVHLLNCCAYDDHNRYARERVQLCLKYLMDGSDEANNFLRNLIRATPAPNAQPGAPQPSGSASGSSSTAAGAAASTTKTLRIDGVEGEVKVEVRPAKPRAPARDGGRDKAAAVPPPAASNPLNHVVIHDDENDPDVFVIDVTDLSVVPAPAAAAAPALPAVPNVPERAIVQGPLPSAYRPPPENPDDDPDEVPPPPNLPPAAQLAQMVKPVLSENNVPVLQTPMRANPHLPVPRDQPEDLLADIVMLANEAARIALHRDGDETEDESFISALITSQRFRDQFRRRLVDRGYALTLLDESCDYFERVLIHLIDGLTKDPRFANTPAVQNAGYPIRGPAPPGAGTRAGAGGGAPFTVPVTGSGAATTTKNAGSAAAAAAAPAATTTTPATPTTAATAAAAAAASAATTPTPAAAAAAANK